MYKNMSVRKRLTITIVSMAILSAIVAGVAIFGLTKINSSFNNFVKSDFEFNNQVRNVQTSIERIARYTAEMALQDDSAKMKVYIDKIDIQRKSIKENVSKMESTHDGNDELLSKFESNLAEWSLVSDSVVINVKSGNFVVANRLILTDNSQKLAALRDSSDKLTNEAVDAANNAAKTNQTVYLFILILVISLAVIALIYSIIISTATTKSILLPLAQIEKAAKEMSMGNLTTAISYKSRNELGKLADSLRDSMQILHNYIWDIENSMNELASGNFNVHSNQIFMGDFENIQISMNKFIITMSGALGQITDASDQVSNGSEQVSDAAQALAQGATEQASSVDEISSTISNISQQVAQNASNANEACKKSNDAGREIGASNQQMLQMIAAMTAITTKSREIGNIISTIDNIAFQTNILALNAAVEAARAGTAGKGFAVVAGEVRNLAVKSAEAAKNTAKLIEESIQAVEVGSRIANETSLSLKQTVLLSNDSTKLINNIAKASNEQAASVAQINLGINQISSVVQTNSATSEETAAASEELSGQANMLKSIVSNFTLFEEE
ncbi:MAG: HAMP domain-containing methyl-accepting chemotaxis protein [Oscillospiraceae bacterium]